MVLTENVHVLIPYLEQKLRSADWAKAKAVLKALKNKQTLAELFFLRDALQPLSKLSKKFQADTFYVHQVAGAVDLTIASLQHILEGDSINWDTTTQLTKFLNKVSPGVRRGSCVWLTGAGTTSEVRIPLSLKGSSASSVSTFAHIPSSLRL